MDITVCMISRGEAGLAAALESTKPIAKRAVVCCDPADKDRVENTLCDLNDMDVKIVEREWSEDFAAQRNFAFGAVETDWAFWLDSDDTLEGAAELAEFLEGAEFGPVSYLMLPYHYAYTEDGKVRIIQERERLVPAKARWKAPIHEIYDTQGFVKVGGAPEACYIKHHVSQEEEMESAERNLRMLERALEVHPDDLRLVEHYAMALMSTNQHEAALKVWASFTRFEKPGVTRGMAYVMMGECYSALDDLDNAAKMVSMSFVDFPNNKHAVRRMFDFEFLRGRWSHCLLWFDRMEQDPALIYAKRLYNPTSLELPWEAAAHAAMELGRLARARRYADEAGMDDYIEEIDGILAVREKAEKWRVKMKKAGLLDRPYSDPEARAWVQKVPEEVRVMVPFALWTLPILTKDKPSVAFHCGEHVIDWGPDSLEKGIGGSEEAVIEMAPRLAAQGFHVEVFGHRNETVEVDGVVWRPWEEILCPDRIFDVVIHWRHSTKVWPDYPGKQVLWLHDVGPKWEGGFDPDEVWVLSDFHKDVIQDQYQGAPFWITRNGVAKDLHKQAEGVEKDPNLLIQASSPDRGLPQIVAWWPEIKEFWPEAKLDIYYGFTPWWMLTEAEKPGHREYRKKVEELVAADPDVNMKGMVPAKELHKAFASAGMWFYPNEFPEISCINAMKAQVLGATPIVANYGALAETVVEGTKIGDPRKQDARHKKEEFLAALKEFREKGAEWKETPQERYDRFSWDGVAEEWAAHLKEMIDVGCE